MDAIENNKDFDNRYCWNEFFSIDTFEGYFLCWCHQWAINDGTFFIYQDTVTIKIRYGSSYYAIGYFTKTTYNKIINQWKHRLFLDLIGQDPQSAVMEWQWGDKKFNTRISLWPTVYGEKLSFRILYNQYTHLSHLNLHPTIYNHILNIIKEPTFFAICGPVGTGKTSLAYGICRQLVQWGCHGMSVENPVEYYCDFFDQGNSTGSVHFNHIMRHGIDTIFVGEILDESTAQQVIQLMATGHRVISTFHCASIEDFQYRWLSLGNKFYKGYGLFPRLMGESNKKMLLEVYDMKGSLLSLTYDEQAS
jgi:type IV pilus assembly protein PilB